MNAELLKQLVSVLSSLVMVLQGMVAHPGLYTLKQKQQVISGGRALFGAITTTAGFNYPTSTYTFNDNDVINAGDFNNILTWVGTRSSTDTKSLSYAAFNPNLASSTGGPLAVSNGGTATSTVPASGQLLIGNASGTYSLNNLVGGTNITITTSSGGITVSTPVSGTNFFGDGRDGTSTITSTTTLTRDMYYSNLTVNATLNTGGYRILVLNTLNGTGTIAAPLPNSALSTSTGATSTTLGDFTNQAGANGGGANCGAGAGSNGNNAATPQYSIGSPGGSGGGTTEQGGSSGGTSAVATTTNTSFATFGSSVFDTYRWLFFNGLSTTTFNVWAEGAGGGGGGGGAANGVGGPASGGGGGSSGFPVWLAANTWSGTFTIQALGGAGSVGGSNGCNGSAQGGGGGGGAGGNSVVIYSTKNWTGSYNLAGGAGGGAGGAGASTGTVGTAGVNWELPINNFKLP